MTTLTEGPGRTRFSVRGWRAMSNEKSGVHQSLTTDTVEVEDRGAVRIVTITRPEIRNAVDAATATALFDAFVDFDADDDLFVAILTGADGNFCAGADLKALSTGPGNHIGSESADEIVGTLGPMGPTRLYLSKPVIAAVEGYAVAGGIELAAWCDLRVAALDAKFGVFCRRFGVPLVDGGTIRLPRLIGESRAADLILTGREVDAEEAASIGLVNRLVPTGNALKGAIELAESLAAFPQTCMRQDLRSMKSQAGKHVATALTFEAVGGLDMVRSGETKAGATRSTEGTGRHGQFF